MVRPIKTSKKNINVFQSFIMTTARYKFSVYEKRILYRLVEIAQSEIQGVKLKDNIGPLYKQRTLFGGMDITLSFSSILDVVSNEENRNNHYECLKSACRALAQKIVEWEDLEQGIWKCQHLIEGVEIKKRVGVVTFSVPEWFWHAILDFSKGYRKYELLTAMKLKSPYSMRFFELMSGQKRPFTLSVEEMRKMFGLEGKYERPSSIRERIIEPAKKELDASAPYSFDVKEERSGKGKTSPISAFTFIPRKHEENQDKDLLKTEMLSKLTARNVFKDKDIYEILRYTFDFDSKEINKNKQTIDRGKDIIPDFVGFLSSLSDAPGYKDAVKKKGYVIQSIKNKTKETLEGNKNINAGEAIQATPPKKGKYTKW